MDAKPGMIKAQHPKSIDEQRKAAEKYARFSLYLRHCNRAVAGAVVSMMAAGAMMNPSVRRSAQHAASKAEHAMHKAATSMGHIMG